MAVNMWLAVLVPLTKEWKNLADDLVRRNTNTGAHRTYYVHARVFVQGDHHDLHCLLGLAVSHELFPFIAEDAMRTKLVAAIDSKRVTLEAAILSRASLLYALEAPAFGAQLAAMWVFWQDKPARKDQ